MRPPYRTKYEIMKIVADQFAETPSTAGLKRGYGNVGDSPNGITDAQRHQGAIVVRSSQRACEGERRRRRRISIVRLAPREATHAVYARDTDHRGRANSRDRLRRSLVVTGAFRKPLIEEWGKWQKP